MSARVLLGAAARFAAFAGLACAVSSCSKSKSAQSGPVTIGSVTLPAPIASGLPIEPKLVSDAVNPKGEAAYAGPTGTISGVVTATGDEAPVMNEALSKIPADCVGAKATYGKLFREGMMRGLADVVIGVTGYTGYLAEEQPTQPIDAAGCAWDARTYVITFGQSLAVSSKDSRTYVPDLLGATTPHAQLVALPRGAAIQLYPEHVGHFGLTDSMHLFMYADVMVVKFPTHAVTAIDGHYAVHHVPVGKVTVSAFLPSTQGHAERQVEVHSGETVEVNFDMAFDLKAWQVKHPGPENASRVTPAPSGSAPKP
jgi:hypothetical protein